MNNKKLFTLLAQSYREYTTEPDAKIIGLAYIEQFHARLHDTAPDLSAHWKSYLETPSGEREKEYLDDAGCFLALMDTMKNLWTETYQTEVERAIQTDPELATPTIYKVPAKGKLLSLIKGFSALVVFASTASFLCVLLANVFASLNPSVLSLMLSLSIALAGATSWVFSSWLWRKHYAKKVRASNLAFEKYNLLWVAKYGAAPLKVNGKFVIPPPPFGWTKHKQDVVKYAQVTDYLKAKFILPFDEDMSRPELVLPEIDNSKLPMEALNDLKDFFKKNLT